MSRLAVLGVFAVLALLIAGTSPDWNVGLSGCLAGPCEVGGGASGVSFVSALLLIGFLWRYPQKTGHSAPHPPVGIVERSAAIVVDFFVVVFAVSPLLALPSLVAEWVVTGEFKWRFSRDAPLGRDVALEMASAFAMQASLFFYLLLHAQAGRETVGQYIVGFRLEADPASDRPPSYITHFLLAAWGLGLWPIAVYMALKRDDRAFWWHKWARTRVVRVVH